MAAVVQPKRTVLGIRSPLSANTVVGRVGGKGAARPVSMDDLATQLLATGKVAPAGAPTVASNSGSGSGLYSPVMSSPVPSVANTGLSTDINFGGSTAVSSHSTGISISDPTISGNALRAITKTAPSTPYTITALVIMYGTQMVDFVCTGIGWIDKTHQKAHVIALEFDNDWVIAVQEWSAYNTIAANEFLGGGLARCPTWLQIKNDGTTLTFAFSFDGGNFLTAHSVALASGFLGSGNYGTIGFFIDPNVNVTPTGTFVGSLLSYKQS